MQLDIKLVKNGSEKYIVVIFHASKLYSIVILNYSVYYKHY